MKTKTQKGQAETKSLTSETMKLHGHYNWKNQPERLVYLGRNWSGNGYWHQFKKIGDPRAVWCEVLDADLHMLEETACGCQKGTCESKATGCRMAGEFEIWYQAAESASGGKIVGERENLRPYWAAAFTPHEAAQLYVGGVCPMAASQMMRACRQTTALTGPAFTTPRRNHDDENH